MTDALSFFQTQTQAQRKIMEMKREVIIREAAHSISDDQRTVEDKLTELDSMKPKPYGTLHAVTVFTSIFLLPF